MNNIYDIVIIDDNLKEDDAFLVEIELQLSIRPILKDKSEDGLNYVLNNLDRNLIVIIDYNFPKKEIQGVDVLKRIREKTSIVSLIMLSSCTPTDIGSDDLVEIINNEAFAFMDRAMDNKQKIEIIKKAIHIQNSRVDAVLERWILNQQQDTSNEPYIVSTNGKTFSLNNILSEIRSQSEFGKQLERNIIQLTVDLLARGKKQLND